MELLNSAKIRLLLKLRPRLTTSQVAEAICLPYAGTSEELVELYKIGQIKQFKTRLGLLVWENVPEEEQGAGSQGAGALTLDMPAYSPQKAQHINPIEIAQNVPDSKLARWRGKRAETTAKDSSTFVAWNDWNAAIDKAKGEWLIKNKKGGYK